MQNPLEMSLYDLAIVAKALLMSHELLLMSSKLSISLEQMIWPRRLCVYEGGGVWDERGGE